jgi:MYXO-CTERM domain-containing protein
MKLLASSLLRDSQLALTGWWFTLVVVGSLAGLEVAGRHASNDAHDGFAAFALLALGAAVAMRHRREPLPWVQAVLGWGRRLGASAAGFRYDHGFDLRGTPPYPRRTPPLVWVILAALAAWGAIAGLAWALFPSGWRVVGQYSSYVLYLAALLLLWGSLLLCTLVGVFVPVTVIDRWVRSWAGETDRRGAELAAVVGYAVLASVVAWLVPPTAVLGVCAAVAAVAAVAYTLPGGDGAAILWRSATGTPVYALPLHRVMALVVGLAAVVMFNLLLTACGGRLSGGEDAMAVTALFGAMTAWLVPGLVLVGVYWLGSAARSDPARRTRPAVSLVGGNAAERKAAAGRVRQWGFRAATADGATAGLELVPAEKSEATEFDPQWPLRVCAADLDGDSVRDRLARRDEIQLRRHFFRGVGKLFRRASAFKGPGGGGFWFAPHWWFIECLGRDDADSGEEAAPPLVGPPYARVLPVRCRQHLHAVLRATRVDMFFVEDGVGYRKLEKVIRVLMELYDVHGGMRYAEEHHFRGLPKVRVMIHDYEPGNPFRSDVYPEPKFDDLSRVRVLHVFRDRGGDEELVEPPFDWSSSPAPVGLVG